MDDSTIIDLLFQRAEGAIDALANRFGGQLRRIAANILSSPQDAEECVADTYLAVWNAIPPQRPAALGGFVCKVGRNIALNRLRSNLAQKRNSRYDLSLEELAGCLPGPGLEDTLNSRELGRAIDSFLDTLSRENRVIFLRRYWFGDSVKDIARISGLSENLVSVRLNRIREKLRHYLIKEGLFDA